jgi:hypothetical protein
LQTVHGNVEFLGNHNRFGALITNNSFIGVNNNSPNYDLDVNGTIFASEKIIADKMQTNLLFIGNHILQSINNELQIVPDTQLTCLQTPLLPKSLVTKEYVDNLLPSVTKIHANYNSEVITNSINYNEVLTLVTGDIPTGLYELSWCYCWAHSSVNSQFLLRIKTRDGVLIHTHIETPGIGNISESRPVSGFAFINLQQGVHEILLEIATSNTNTSSKVQFVTLKLSSALNL